MIVAPDVGGDLLHRLVYTAFVELRLDVGGDFLHASFGRAYRKLGQGEKANALDEKLEPCRKAPSAYLTEGPIILSDT